MGVLFVTPSAKVVVLRKGQCDVENKDEREACVRRCVQDGMSSPYQSTLLNSSILGMRRVWSTEEVA